MFGWTGTILWVDLTHQVIEKKPLDKELAKAFLGGRGLNSKILYDHFDPKITDPFDPQNIVCISTGVLTGTTAPSSGRITISFARSPITGVFGDGNAGGHFGPELKYAGYDAIVIMGASDKPVYLAIQDDVVELRAADHIWSQEVHNTDKILRQEIGSLQTQVLAIGPAGENLVSGACTLCNITRAAGAGGSGAILGSKKLKAIAVRGTKGFGVADPVAFTEACNEAHDHIRAHPLFEQFQLYGTTCFIERSYPQNVVPVFNWQANQLPGWEGLKADVFIKHYAKRSVACFGCPIHCSNYYHVDEGPFAGTCGEGPEWEAIAGFGLKLGITDFPAVLYINSLCNRLGLDVVQTSSVCSTAMHLWQDSVITAEDTQGLDLAWGNVDAAIELIRQVAYREGFGRIFSDGILPGVRNIAASKGIAPEKLERYVIHTKGMTYSGLDLRKFPGSALGYATSTRGGDHLRGRPKIPPELSEDPAEINRVMDIPLELAEAWVQAGITKDDQYEDIGHVLKFFQDQCAVADAVEICKFTSSWRFGVGPSRMARLVSAATGMPYTWEDILKVGERIYAVEYAMQRRFGLGPESDQPPARFFEEKTQSGYVLDKVKFEASRSQYYEIRGYDTNGVPTEKKLLELGLQDVAADLEQREVAAKLQKASA